MAKTSVLALRDELGKSGGFTAKLTDYGFSPIHPETGYAVSLRNCETRVSRFVLNDELFAAIVDAYRLVIRTDLLANAIAYFGAWKENEYITFDVSRIYEDLDSAMYAAKVHGQRAIYDFAAKKSINV